MHRFYHADRAGSLAEHQTVELNADQLSRFGSEYWSIISEGHTAEMSDAQLREFHLEQIRRQSRFSVYASRMQSIFAANSLEEAIRFAEIVTPVPANPIPIIEIFAESFWSLDMNWLDYDCPINQRLQYYEKYWYAEISNHRPTQGERRPPRIEVMIALPARTGRIVHHVNPADGEISG